MIFPVIMTGGIGTRLWPVSRKSFPKQFRAMNSDASLFQETVKRIQAEGFADPMVLTGEDFRFIVQDQLQAISVKASHILVEPEGRNTGPAILAAALYLERHQPGSVMLVLPSDHSIPDVTAFRAMVQTAQHAVQDGQIVTFGVTPDRPETGYGYLELSTPAEDHPVPLKGFVEKPDLATAENMVKTGMHLWNAGIFMFRSDTILKSFQTHAPDLVLPIQKSVDGAEPDLGFNRLLPAAWADVRDVSIDYAIMEHADNLSVMAFNGSWSDLGSWEAIWRDVDRDTAGVGCIGNTEAVDCKNSLLFCEQGGPAVIGFGLNDLVVVSTKDAVLVADKARSQNIKTAVDHLKARGEVTATQTPEYHRPWGWYETLALGGRFQVKRIVVRPGGMLSLQSHHHRSEHWIVVEGTARVTVDDTVKLVTENQSVYIPLGSVHRLENPGKLSMVLIEVQTGAYLGEDDIVRYEDIYHRTTSLPEFG